MIRVGVATAGNDHRLGARAHLRDYLVVSWSEHEDHSQDCCGW